MSGELIQVQVDDGVATLTLNDPPLNLVTLALTRQLGAALDRLADDAKARVLVVTGAGKRAFSAGSDIKEFPSVKDDVVGKKLGPENEVYSRLDDFRKPTVAAVQGLAMGGGLELALCCDLLVVEEDARLALPEIKLAVFPGSGGTVRVTRRIGEGRAKEMMFLGEPVDPETALAWELVNRVVRKGRGLDEAIDLARALARRPNRALQLCKRAIDLSFDVSEDEAIRRTLDLSREAFASEDIEEGVRAFLAKETARFRHR